MKYLFNKFSILALVLIVILVTLFLIKKDKPLETGPVGVPSALGEAFDRGDFDQAITLAFDILKENPKDIYALLFISQTYAQKGSLEFREEEYGLKALDYANQALSIDQNNSKVYIALGYANEIMQKYPESFAAYTKAIELEPKNAEGYIRLGHAYDLSGNLAMARENYLKAASIDPTNPQVAQNLGRLYARSGDSVKAQEQFLIVASTTPNVRLKAEAYYNLSTMAFYSNSENALEQSMSYASSSLAVDPDYPQTYLALGRIYVSQEDFKNAEIMLAKALDLYPNMTGAYDWRANMLIRMGKSQEAIDTYEIGKKIALVDIALMGNERGKIISDANLNQAFLYAKLGEKEKAFKSLKESVDYANPLGLLIIQFTLENINTSELKILADYPPFNELKIFVDKKIESYEKSTFKNNFKKVFSFLKPKVVIADSGTCGYYRTQPVAWSYNGWNFSTRVTSIYFCNVLLEYLNDDYSRLAEAIIKANLVDGATTGDGLMSNYNGISGAYFLGCANGVGATYIPITRTLTTTKNGTGGGTISGTGISCGGDCSHVAANYTVIVLTATPNASSTFAGWTSGGCSGTGTCSVTLNSNKTVNATFSLIATTQAPPTIPVTASCSVSPSSAITGQTVTWTATSTGFTGTPSYSWSGDDFIDGKTSASVSGTYSSHIPSVKHATTTISDGLNIRTVSCPGSVGSTGSCTGNCGEGINITEATVDGECLAGTFNDIQKPSFGFCLDGSTPTPVDGGTDGPWSWTCAGSGPNHNDKICYAYKRDPLDSNLTCSLSKTSPDTSKIFVNNNSEWTTTSSCSNCSVRWTVRDDKGTSYPDETSKVLNKIFTTVGIKEIGAEIASTTEGVWGPICTTSVNVIQSAGQIIES